MLRGLVKLIRYMDSLNGPADMDIVGQLMKEANVHREDMVEACKFNNTRYARNLLAKGDWYQLLVICWKCGQSSPIHDHFGSACGVRVVDGIATETTYEKLPSGEVRPVSVQTANKGDVLTAEDCDIHLITNEQADLDLITLHLYSPPLNMRFFQEEGSWAES